MISKYVSFEEATKSATATRKGIDNTPSEDIIKVMETTAKNVFDPLREKVGPIRVTSFYRCPALNKAIGGSKSSQHMKGEAIDMSSMKVSNRELFKAACELEEFDQLIWEFGTNQEPDWIHISYSKTHNRKQILKAKRVNGATRYEPMSKL